MGEQRLSWSAGAPSFSATDAYGTSFDVMSEDHGAGVKPSDLLPLSLAACLGYTVLGILKKQRQDLRALDASIETTQDDDPPWKFRKIAVRFVARGTVDQVKAEKALARAHEKWCSVSETLKGVVDLDLSITVE